MATRGSYVHISMGIIVDLTMEQDEETKIERAFNHTI